MLLNLRTKLYNSKVVSKVIVATLVLLLVVPNLVGMLSSRDSMDEVIVASNKYSQVSLKKLYSYYPEQVSMVISMASDNENYSRILLQQLLKDLSVRNYIEDNNLLPTNEFVWNQLRAQVQQQYQSQGEELTNFQEVDQKINQMLPSDSIKRANALDSMRFKYAYTQLGQSLYDLGSQASTDLMEQNYLYRDHLYNQYTIKVSDFIDEATDIDPGILEQYYSENSDKYSVDNTYDIEYQTIDFSTADLLELYDESLLHEELQLYDRDDASDDDVLDFAKVKFTRAIEQHAKSLSKTRQDIDQEALTENVAAFIKEHTTESKFLDEYTQKQVMDFLGINSAIIFQESQGAANNVDLKEDNSTWHLVVHNGRYYLVKIMQEHLSHVMPYEQAYLDVKQDYLHDKAAQHCKSLVEQLADYIKGSNDVVQGDPQWKGILVDQKTYSLKDNIDIADQRSEQSKELQPFLELVHPSVDKNKSVKVVYDSYSSVYKVISYDANKLDSQDSISSITEDSLKGVEDWLENNRAQNYVALFLDLVENEYRYVMHEESFKTIKDYSRG